MKQCIVFFLSAVIFCSCMKSDNRDFGIDYSPEGYLKYLFDGSPFEYSGGPKSLTERGIGVYAKKQLKSATVPATRYIITGQIGVANQINVVIVTDSLKPGTFVSTSAASAPTSIKKDSAVYTGNRPGDGLTINISSFSKGIIEGTISGKLSNAKTTNGSTTYKDAEITNGSFKNLVVLYP